MPEASNMVILELTPEDRERLKSRWGIYKGSNVKSVSLSRLRRQMMLFCAEAFGDGKGEK